MAATPKKAARTSKKRAISDEHKVALAEGRTQGAAVRRYLELLEANTLAKRGGRRTLESVEKQLQEARVKADSGRPLDRLHARQAIKNLEAAQAALTAGSTFDTAATEAQFVKHAKAYSERKGISRDVWRQSGVPADVLKRAAL